MNREEHAMLQFNTWSGFYDILLKIPFYISNRTIAQAIHLQDGMSILDVGCGTGILISQLNAKQKKVEFYGVDISPKMVAVAKKKFKENNVHIFEGTSSRLPYKDDTFDYVICATSLHHHSDPSSSIEEMVRVLKTAGTILVLEPQNTGTLRKMINKTLNIVFMEGDTSIFTNKEMKDMFVKAGLKNINQKNQWYYRLLTSGVKK